MRRNPVRMNLDDFRDHSQFGSLGRREDRPPDHTIPHDMEEVEQAAKHMEDIGGWIEAGIDDARSKIDRALGQDEIESTDDVFEKKWVAEKDHYGLEVDIEADSPEEARQKLQESLDSMGFEHSERPGFSGGSEQLFRDGDGINDGKQEHMRFYGVVEDEDDPGHYKALFVMEGGTIPVDQDTLQSIHQGLLDSGYSEEDVAAMVADLEEDPTLLPDALDVAGMSQQSDGETPDSSESQEEGQPASGTFAASDLEQEGKQPERGSDDPDGDTPDEGSGDGTADTQSEPGREEHDTTDTDGDTDGQEPGGPEDADGWDDWSDWNDWGDWNDWNDWGDWNDWNDWSDWNDWNDWGDWNDWNNWDNWDNWSNWDNWDNWADWQNWGDYGG